MEKGTCKDENQLLIFNISIFYESHLDECLDLA